MISYKDFTLNQGKKNLTMTRRKLLFTIACLHELNFFLQIKVWFSFVFSHQIFKSKANFIMLYGSPKFFKRIFFKHVKLKFHGKNLKLFKKKTKKKKRNYAEIQFTNKNFCVKGIFNLKIWRIKLVMECHHRSLASSLHLPKILPNSKERENSTTQFTFFFQPKNSLSQTKKWTWTRTMRVCCNGRF